MLKNKRKTNKLKIVFLLFLIFFIIIFWKMFVRFEGNKPELALNQKPYFIGASNVISGMISDIGTGISKYKIQLIKENERIVLEEKSFPAEFFSGKTNIYEHFFKISIEPSQLMISDGKAKLNIEIYDHSWRHFFSPNQMVWECDLLIDTKSPEIEVLSKQHNLNQGGAGLAVYRISENETINGIYVGDNFYKGYSGYYKDPLIYICLFALSHKQGTETELYIAAEDRCQNMARIGFYYHINNKKYRHDNLGISDNFLKKNLPDFYEFFGDKLFNSDIEKFLYINRKIRKNNFDKIKSICQISTNKFYFTDDFLRLPKSATKAYFGDKRSYYYKGKKIDNQTHLGIDLASLLHSPIPAANKGKVIFCQKLGIYGKTVIIDHGFGLFSMYSHLSRLKTERDKIVSKGEIIGNTGSTGLAGGDHLHYSIIVQGTFCNPIEWWDRKWIQYNILDKLESSGT